MPITMHLYKQTVIWKYRPTGVTTDRLLPFHNEMGFLTSTQSFEENVRRLRAGYWVLL